MLLDARCVYQVLVEGSSAAMVPHAVRLARRMAREIDGVVVDGQTGELWSSGRSRMVGRPVPRTRVDVVDLRWYRIARDLPEDIPQLYLDLCRRYLPEALPRRYGDLEPLQHRLDQSGDGQFNQMWAAATSSLHFTTACVGGGMWVGPGSQHDSVVIAAAVIVGASSLVGLALIIFGGLRPADQGPL